MEANMFTGMYEYMGFAIYNGGSKHIWDIEPLNWSDKATDNFKNSSQSFKTVAAAKKWIKNEGQNLTEEQYK